MVVINHNAVIVLFPKAVPTIIYGKSYSFKHKKPVFQNPYVVKPIPPSVFPKNVYVALTSEKSVKYNTYILMITCQDD